MNGSASSAELFRLYALVQAVGLLNLRGMLKYECVCIFVLPIALFVIHTLCDYINLYGLCEVLGIDFVI